MTDDQAQLGFGFEEVAAPVIEEALDTAVELPAYDPSWRDALPEDRSAIIIDTPSELVGLAHDLMAADAFAFDTETTGLDPIADRLVGISIAITESEAFYIPVRHRMGNQLSRSMIATALRPVFSESHALKIAHNALFDLRFLTRFLGIDPRAMQPLFDTMLACAITNWDERRGLKELARTYLHTEMTTYADLTSTTGSRASQTVDYLPISLVARYACADANSTLRIKAVMACRIDTLDMQHLFRDVEMPLVPIVAAMEDVGLPIDVPYLQSLAKEMEKDIAVITEEIYRHAGERFTIDSPQQLGAVLFAKLSLPMGRQAASAPSTDASVLEGLVDAHPIARALLTYRELTKVKSTYVDAILEGSKRDGRLHPRYRQIGAVTGRFSCTDPNLQSVPKDSESRIRRAVAATDGRTLIRADYSQIELRVVAHFSQDPALLGAFERGEDVHKRTASQMFRIDLDAVTKDQREHAKKVNFGLIYGMSARSLARSIGVSDDDGDRYYAAYFSGYPLVRAYLERIVLETKRTGGVYTLLGRRRAIPELHSDDPREAGRAERQAKNTPIQGTAADIIKIAMIRLADQLVGADGCMILQVHDELLVECDETDADQVAEIVRRAMEEAPTPEFRCPLAVDLAIGRTWAG